MKTPTPSTIRSAVAALIGVGMFCSVLVAAGCSGEATATTLEGLIALTVSPDGAVMVVEDERPAVHVYRAMGTFRDGATRDVSGLVTWSLGRRELGSFEGAELRTATSYGGRTTVLAQAGDISATVGVTIQVRRSLLDPLATGLTSDARARFGGAPAASAHNPRIVYPSDGVLVPPNLRRLELHFLPGESNTLFEISFRSAILELTVYTRCVTPLRGGCIYEPDASAWGILAQSSRGDSVTVRVRGTDDRGSAVGASEMQRIDFSQDDIGGGIYYWTTSSTASSDTAIVRFDFGAEAGAVPERVVGTEMTGGHCVGCHTVSRNGQKLLTAAEGSYDAYVLLLDIATRTPLVPFARPPRSAFSSWSPDASRYVGVFADETEEDFVSYDLNLFDGNTGMSVGTIAVGGTEDQPTNHPDWAPDGGRIAFTRVGQAANTESGTIAYAHRCSISVVANDGASWGAPIALTSPREGEGTYYPTFSPEGDLLAFNRSRCEDGTDGAGCDAYDDPSATLFLMRPVAGAEPVECARANAPGVMDTAAVVQNSFPKWAPFTFRRTVEFGSRLHWITFSSNRRYGLRELEAGHTLIWMAAIDPDLALEGMDPSFTAFALPFQDLETDNHTAQWTERIVTIE